MLHIEFIGMVKHNHSNKPSQPNALHLQMREMYVHGKTMREIGVIFGISRERVRQLLKKHFSLTRTDGGANIKSYVNEEYRQKARAIKKAESIYTQLGCTVDFFDSVQPNTSPNTPFTPSRRYIEQRNSANRRGITWEFNFKEWWNVWSDSGKWALRGRGNGYCMARIGDTGPYSKDNVEIITISQNFSDSFIKHPQFKRKLFVKLGEKNGKD